MRCWRSSAARIVYLALHVSDDDDCALPFSQQVGHSCEQKGERCRQETINIKQH